MKVEKVTEPVVLGEGPHWDASTSTLYYVDFEGNTLHSYKPSTGSHSKSLVNTTAVQVSPSFIIPCGAGRFIVSDKNKNTVLRIAWDGVTNDQARVEDVLVACDVEGDDQDEYPTKLNDAKASPDGRLFTGTMGKEIPGRPGEFIREKGALYSIGRGETKFTKHLDKVSLSNGMAWSLDGTKFYYIDSLKYKIDSYDYNSSNATLSNQTTLFDLKKSNLPGTPDGMTVDSQGKLIVAIFGGGQVLRIDPTNGEILEKIPVPVPQVTSVAFGGDNYEDLYVTTANLYPTKESTKLYPDAGSVFRFTQLGFKGVAPLQLKL